jgi:hypothetical protein
LELAVWHDGSGFGSGWNLAYMQVQHVHSGQVSKRLCKQSSCLAVIELRERQQQLYCRHLKMPLKQYWRRNGGCLAAVIDS